MTKRSPFRYFKTSPEIIRLAVMMYVRFGFLLMGGLISAGLVYYYYANGFVAQIVLKTFLPLPQTDSAYGFCFGYAKSGEAI
jgi:hypothetical protein